MQMSITGLNQTQMGWEHIHQHIFNCAFSQRLPGISYILYVTM